MDIEKSLIGTKMRNQIAFATIHGTILSIIIGLSSVYTLYFFGISNELDQNAINEALRVNKIKTNRSWYKIAFFATAYSQNLKNHFNETGIDSDTQNFKMIDRLQILIRKPMHKIHKKDSSTTKGTGAKRPDEWFLKNREINGLTDIEEILCIMTIIRLSNPFRKELDLEFPSTLNINNISDVDIWIKSFKQLILLMSKADIYDLEELFISHKWPDRLFVKMSENLSKNYLFEEFGLKTDFKIKSLPYVFIEDLRKLSDIYYSTLSYKRRINKLRDEMPSPFIVKIVFSLSVIAFFLAVVYPLICVNAKPRCYVLMPILFYIVYFWCVLWVVFF